MFGQTFSQANGAAVAQIWTRSALSPRVLYINDTARAAGDRNEVSFASMQKDQKIGSDTVAMVQSNLLWEHQEAADVAPFRVSMTILQPRLLQNNIVEARGRGKDFWAWVIGQCQGTDAKVDDFIAYRAWLP